jgi:hypothetical protein
MHTAHTRITANTQAFIDANGIDPMVQLRDGTRLQLSQCGILAQRLMQILTEAMREEPGAAAFVGIGLDDDPDVVAMIFIDPGSGETDTPATTEIDLDGTPAIVEFTGMQRPEPTRITNSISE